MNLTPREKDKLLISMAAMVARRRLERGVKLNHPEAIAIISDFIVEGARDDDFQIDPRQALELLAALEAMERHLTGRDFFVGDRATVADIALYAYTHVADEGGFEIARYEAVGAWLERVRSLPGYIEITA